MITIRNPQVKKSRAQIYNIHQAILTEILDTPVSFNPPKSPLDQVDAGYIVHYLSRNECKLPFNVQPEDSYHKSGNDEFSFSLLMLALDTAFVKHIPFSLSPEIAWYLIAHEIATHIRLNPKHYRSHFTASKKRDTLVIQDDSLVYGDTANAWGRSINLIREPLRAKVPKVTLDLMLPRFSTSTDESDTALLVLFLDIMSNYCDMWTSTMCGIPAVRLEGTAEDWKIVIQHTEMARSAFTLLAPYFDDLLPVLNEIAGTAAGAEPDPQFWSSIYKFDDESGGPFITGWITAFLAHLVAWDKTYEPREVFNWRDKSNSMTTDQFPAHLCRVPFVWNYYQHEINMVFLGGILGIEHDGFLTPRLGYGVLEKRDYEKPELGTNFNRSRKNVR